MLEGLIPTINDPSDIVDGSDNSFSKFTSGSSSPRGMGFYIDLEERRKVVGVTIKYCGSAIIFNHFEVSLSDSTTMSLGTGDYCNTVSNAAVGSPIYTPCIEGTKLSSNIFYQYGRYIHMILNENAPVGAKCMLEVKVYGF